MKKDETLPPAETSPADGKMYVTTYYWGLRSVSAAEYARMNQVERVYASSIDLKAAALAEDSPDLRKKIILDLLAVK